jgi:hypothetical protein
VKTWAQRWGKKFQIYDFRITICGFGFWGLECISDNFTVYPHIFADNTFSRRSRRFNTGGDFKPFFRLPYGRNDRHDLPLGLRNFPSSFGICFIGICLRFLSVSCHPDTFYFCYHRENMGAKVGKSVGKHRGRMLGEGECIQLKFMNDTAGLEG